MTDFSRLSESWIEWCQRAHLSNPLVSRECDDCEIVFRSNDYSVHLRRDGTWWIIDTVDDRGNRHNDAAQLSTFELAEKYLIWDWGSMARGIIGARRLGPDFYAMGFSPEIEAIPIAEGIAELRSPRGIAILMEPYATIFSHVMTRSLAEVERLLMNGIGS